jgi:hypothetical protein
MARYCTRLCNVMVPGSDQAPDPLQGHDMCCSKTAQPVTAHVRETTKRIKTGGRQERSPK